MMLITGVGHITQYMQNAYGHMEVAIDFIGICASIKYFQNNNDRAICIVPKTWRDGVNMLKVAEDTWSKNSNASSFIVNVVLKAIADRPVWLNIYEEEFVTGSSLLNIIRVKMDQ